MATVEIYIKPFCPYCVAAISLLKKKQVKYSIIDITGNNELREEMIKRSNGSSTVPQIFVNSNIHIGGHDDMKALNSQGKLDELLEIDKQN